MSFVEVIVVMILALIFALGSLIVFLYLETVRCMITRF